MKLFARYNRVNTSATIITFLIGSILFYFVLQYVLVRQLDQGLYVEQQEIQVYVQMHNSLPDLPGTKHQWTLFKPTTAVIAKPKPRSVGFYNKSEDENESIRQLEFTIAANNKLYDVIVNQSEAETEDLLKLIILVTVGMIGVILLSNYLVNRKLVVRLWKPFYNTIDNIKDYHLTIQQPLQLTKEPIDEINLLNESLNKMTLRIHQDYLALKTFTENASHEMQTPLAVIRLKVEALLQENEGNEKSIKQLSAIEDASLKLSRLHQSLLLLTKLEHGQFQANEPVDLQAIIRAKLEEKQELIISRQIFLVVNIEPVALSFHPHLAEILVNNLLNNAIRYTPSGGAVEIQLTPVSLSVSNSAMGASLDTAKVFSRFYKAEQATDGTGLGLAIIREICMVAGFTVGYRFTNEKHDFTIYFNN